MAIQLKDLKFGDYTLKGDTNEDGGRNYLLGGVKDALTYEYMSGSGESMTRHEGPIIDHTFSIGCSTVWHFHGGADYAEYASIVDVTESGTTQVMSLCGKTIPTLSKGGSNATLAELEGWINEFVGRFSNGSAQVITGTYIP